ncbi:uncharacterized protein [Clytia hemisphaerica]|uniref:C2H2-type domain-containing protein n=1 Tax=Clytia hemisphaerica TaxID=252671 RepID=A0A7M5WRR6_9CNID
MFPVVGKESGEKKPKKRKQSGKMPMKTIETLSKMAKQSEDNNSIYDNAESPKPQFGGIKHIKLPEFRKSTEKEDTEASSVYMHAGLKLDAFDCFHKSLNECFSGRKMSVSDAAYILKQISPAIIMKIVKENTATSSSKTSQTELGDITETVDLEGSVDLEVSELTKLQKDNQRNSFRKPKNILKRPDASRPTRMLSPGSNSCSPTSAAVQALISISAPLTNKTDTTTQSTGAKAKTKPRNTKKVTVTFLPVAKPPKEVLEKVFMPVKPEAVIKNYNQVNKAGLGKQPEVEVAEVMSIQRKQFNENIVTQSEISPQMGLSSVYNPAISKNLTLTQLKLNEHASSIKSSMNYNMYNHKENNEDTLSQFNLLLNAQTLPVEMSSLSSPYGQVLHSSPMPNSSITHPTYSQQFSTIMSQPQQSQVQPTMIPHPTCQESPTIPMQTMTSQMASMSPHPMQQQSLQPSPHHMQQSPHSIQPSPHQIQPSPVPDHQQVQMHAQMVSPTPMAMNQDRQQPNPNMMSPTLASHHQHQQQTYTNMMSHHLRTILPKPFEPASTNVVATTSNNPMNTNEQIDQSMRTDDRFNVHNITISPNQMFAKTDLNLPVSVTQNQKITIMASNPSLANIQALMGNISQDPTFLQQLAEAQQKSLMTKNTKLPQDGTAQTQVIASGTSNSNKRFSDSGGGQLEVASALLSMGTGSDSTTLDMSVLTDDDKMTSLNTNLEDLIEESLRGEQSNVSIAFNDSGVIKIDDVEIDPNLHVLKKDSFTCGKCKRVFTTIMYLARHIKRVCPDMSQRKWKCNKCSKAFRHPFGLQQHMFVHTGERPYKCSHASCTKAFYSTNDLRRHERTHSGERPYECPECHKRFSTTISLKTHSYTHTGERPHRCPHCIKTFATSSKLSRHVVTHSEKRPFPCDQCPKTFNRSGDLRKHYEQHSGKTQELVQCDMCNKSFATLQGLMRHKATHNAQPPLIKEIQ